MSPTPENPVRILVVDDSAVIRGFVSRALSDTPALALVGSVSDGAQALEFLKRNQVDVIILDIEMPVMTGLQALPEIIRIAPDARVVMSSTLTSEGAEVTVRALALGAADYVTKPTSTREADSTTEWKRDLTAKVQALGAAAWNKRQIRSGNLTTATAPAATVARPAPVEPKRLYGDSEVKLRSAGRLTPEIVAIGSSTGGPQALFQVLPKLKGLPQPIVITQHMPKTFTAILAQHITRETGLNAVEAKTGDILQPGQVYVAPGDYHMLFERVGLQVKVVLDQGPQENFCRPAVDPMLRSLMSIYGAEKMLVVILTGMGSDGAKGARPVAEGGGTVLAQDQASSVVWGMPGAVATAGICAAVLPITEIGAEARKMARA